MNEEKKVCPGCGSNLVTAIANGWHCNSCGADYGVERNPISAAAIARKSEGFRGGWKLKK